MRHCSKEQGALYSITPNKKAFFFFSFFADDDEGLWRGDIMCGARALLDKKAKRTLGLHHSLKLLPPCVDL